MPGAVMKFASATMTQASGSAGGITASRNRGGMYFRARAIPTNPNTALQQEVRQNLGASSNIWSTILTQDQRDGWDLYAKNVPVIDRLGASMLLSGINMYNRSNTPRLQAGLASIPDAPADFNLGTTPNIVSIVGVLGVYTLTYGPALTADDRILFYLGRPQNAGKSFFRGPYQFSEARAGVAVTWTVPIGATWQEGQKIYVRCQVTRADGRLSQEAQSSFIYSLL